MSTRDEILDAIENYLNEHGSYGLFGESNAPRDMPSWLLHMRLHIDNAENSWLDADIDAESEMRQEIFNTLVLCVMCLEDIGLPSYTDASDEDMEEDF